MLRENGRTMDVIETHKLGNQLLREFGLTEKGWRFRISNTKRSLGRCFHADKTIELSRYYLHIPDSEIENTIRHEIAHALVGPNHGHDRVWELEALKCGAVPERLAAPTLKSSAQYNYVIKCSCCGKELAKRHRLRQSFYRGKVSACCNAELKFYKYGGQHG
jgi:predicted SprT family Zn-dependent metalloprotease